MKPFVKTRTWMISLILLVLIAAVGFSCSGSATDQKSLQALLNTPGLSDAALGEKLQGLVSKMPLEQKVGQMLMPDYRKWNGSSVTAMNSGISAQIKKYSPGGIILFSNNFKTETQTKKLIKDFQGSATIPLMIGTDQEGGLVTRLPYFPEMPGNMALGAAASTELTTNVASAIGSELKRLGIQIDFAPVLDINSNPNNPVIGVRSFGDQADQVGQMGVAYVNGLNQAGIAAVGKHFPGHGDLDTDSHYTLPVSNKTVDELSALEQKPFKAVIDNGIQGIMTAHIAFSKIDPSSVKSIKDGLPIGIPASLSPKITTDLLRNKLGFSGLIFTDAMEMNAVASHFKLSDAVVRAVKAGADVILMPEDLGEAYRAILSGVKTGKLTEDRINESVVRILKFKYHYVAGNGAAASVNISKAAAAKLEQTAAAAAVTVVNNGSSSGIIPVGLKVKKRIAIIGSNASDLERLETVLQKYASSTLRVKLDSFGNSDGHLLKSQKEQIQKADYAVVITNIASLKEDQWQVKAAQGVINTAVPTIVIADRNPYTGTGLTGNYAYIAQYSDSMTSFTATANVIFGMEKASGKLPVNIGK